MWNVRRIGNSHGIGNVSLLCFIEDLRGEFFLLFALIIYSLTKNTWFAYRILHAKFRLFWIQKRIFKIRLFIYFLRTNQYFRSELITDTKISYKNSFHTNTCVKQTYVETTKKLYRFTPTLETDWNLLPRTYGTYSSPIAVLITEQILVLRHVSILDHLYGPKMYDGWL